MKSTSKIISIFCMLLIIVAFCGCGQVKAVIRENLDGTIDEYVYVYLDEEQMKIDGMSESEILILKQDIKTKSSQICDNYIAMFNAKIETAKESATPETIETLNEFKSGLKKVQTDWVGSSILVGLTYENIDVYKFFYNITSSSSNEPNVEEHFFYNKYIYESKTLFYKHSGLYDEMVVHFSTYANLNLEGGDLIYTYVSSSKREHSNADEIKEIDGLYYHSWNVEDKNQDVVFYYNVANPEAWIITALLITGVVAVVLLTVAICVETKKIKRDKIHINK